MTPERKAELREWAAFVGAVDRSGTSELLAALDEAEKRAEETKVGHVFIVAERDRLRAENEALTKRVERLRERLVAISEVPCVRTWGKHPMLCYPKDGCTFCRVRAALAEDEEEKR